MSNNNGPQNGWYSNGCGALDLSFPDHAVHTRQLRPFMKDASTQYDEADFCSDTKKRDASTQYEEEEIKSPPKKKFKLEMPKRRLADLSVNLSIRPSGSFLGWSAYQLSLQGSFLKRLLESPTEESAQDEPSGPAKSLFEPRLSSTGEVLPPDPFMVSESLADLDYIPTKEDYEYRDPRTAAQTQSEEHLKNKSVTPQNSMPSTSKKSYEQRDPRLAARKQKEIAPYDEYCAQLKYEQMRRSEVAAYLAQHYGIADEKDDYEDNVQWDFNDDVPLSLMTSNKRDKENFPPKYKLEDNDPPHIFNPMTKMYHRLFNGDQVQFEAEIHYPPSSSRTRKNSEKSQSSTEADMEVALIMSNAPPDDFNEIIVIPATPEEFHQSSSSGRAKKIREKSQSSIADDMEVAKIMSMATLNSPPRLSPKRCTSPTGSMSPFVGSNAGSTSPKSSSNQSDYSLYEEDEEIGPEGEQEKHEEGENKNEKDQLEIKEDHFAHEDSTPEVNENKENEPPRKEQTRNEPTLGGYDFDEVSYMKWIRNSSEFPKRRHSF